MATKKTVYESADGKTFHTIEAAREHEKSGTLGAIANLSVDQITAGIRADDDAIREAITAAFHLVQRERGRRGLVKARKRPHEVAQAPTAG